MPKLRHPQQAGLHLRVVLRDGVAMGPGRADLLQGIAELGSIAAAGRAMGMSYRRAWLLMDETARAFGGTLVVAAQGGRSGGGARLTERGIAVLEAYRRLEGKAADAVEAEIRMLQELAEAPDGGSDHFSDTGRATT